MRLITRAHKGFTLIELLVVIAIIALLLSIIMPALSKVKETAKLVVCASNQKQLILGVSAYAVDNDEMFPTSVAFNPISKRWNFPNLLNVLNIRERAVGYYLGDYLPEVGVFMCPNAPQKSKSIYQKAYYDYENVTEYSSIFSSYNMYWGGYTMSDIDFVGPVKQTSKNKLLVSDVLSFGPDGLNGLGRWYSSHGSREEKSKVAEDKWGNLMSALYFVDLPIDQPPGDVAMNRGLADGSVDRYTTDETREHKHGDDGKRAFRVPTKNTNTSR